MSTPKIKVTQFKKPSATNPPFVTVTAYDSVMAALVERAQIPLILVGDSVGMTQLGYSSTVPVTMQDILHHVSAVRRGAPNTFVVADMPFGSYHTTDAQAIENAVRLIQSGADAVKLEGGVLMAPLIAKMLAVGIPVMAHIGLLPQQVMAKGGYFLYGKTEAEKASLLADAEAVQAAGCFSVVLEGVIPDVAAEISKKLLIPTVGIASGTGCDTHIQVINDLLNLSATSLPRHAHPYCNLAATITQALETYKKDVESGAFGRS